jgi:hypothetical protein
LTSVKSQRDTTKDVFFRAIILAFLYCLVNYFLFKILESGQIRYSEVALKFVLFIEFVLFLLPPLLSISAHKDGDLNGKISYGRAVGIGTLSTVFVGLLLSIFLQTNDITRMLSSYLPAKSIFILLLFFAQIGFILSSIFGAMLENYDYNVIYSPVQNFVSQSIPIAFDTSAPQEDNVYTQLEKLAELKTLGILTDAEFEAQKQLILRKMS